MCAVLIMLRRCAINYDHLEGSMCIHPVFCAIFAQTYTSLTLVFQLNLYTLSIYPKLKRLRRGGGGDDISYGMFKQQMCNVVL